MPLYQGLNRRSSEEALTARPARFNLGGQVSPFRTNRSSQGRRESAEWTVLHFRKRSSENSVAKRPLLEALFKGASQKAQTNSGQAMRRLAMEVVDDGASFKKKHRGLIRVVLGVGFAVWVLAITHPLHSVGKFFEHLSKMRGQRAAAPPASAVSVAAAQASPEQDENAQEAVPVSEKEALSKLILPPEPTPQGTPVASLEGEPIALYQSGSKWYEVDEQGYVQASGGPEQAEHLGLPVLSGRALKPVVEHGKWVLRLEVNKEDLGNLFPLRPELASEIDKIILSDPQNPNLITHSGTLVYLGEGNLHLKQDQLAMVLADLAGKGKHAKLIDLRFDNSAVVRLASSMAGRRRAWN